MILHSFLRRKTSSWKAFQGDRCSYVRDFGHASSHTLVLTGFVLHSLLYGAFRLLQFYQFLGWIRTPTAGRNTEAVLGQLITPGHRQVRLHKRSAYGFISLPFDLDSLPEQGAADAQWIMGEVRCGHQYCGVNVRIAAVSTSVYSRAHPRVWCQGPGHGDPWQASAY